jgi:hypothetical protein
MNLRQFIRLSFENAQQHFGRVPARWEREYHHWQTWAAFRAGLAPYCEKQARAYAKIGPDAYWRRIEKRKAAYQRRLVELQEREG